MRVLLPVINLRTAQPLISLAEALLGAGADCIVLAGLVGVDKDQPLSKGAYRARRRRRDLATLAGELADLPLKVDPHVRVSYDPLSDLATLLAEHNCDTVLLHLTNDGQCALGLPVETILAGVGCRVVLQRSKLPAAPERILLTSRGGEHAMHAAGIAIALGDTLGSKVTLLHARLTGSEGQPTAELIGTPPGLRRMSFAREITIRGALVNLIETLQHELEAHQVLVLGTTAQAAVRGTLGFRTRAILDSVDTPAVIVHAPVEFKRLLPRREPLPLSARVDQWFAENTFDADEFSDLGRLTALKETRELTISLGLPALNEEATISKVITTVRGALMDEYPLLDEIVLIDSNSTDATVEIAESMGIPVYRHSEILPEMGSFVGKGEALWKSLYVLRGDIVVWVDTDIVNIHPRFIYGLLGPLLVSPQIKYVKGFYRRPLRVGDKLQASGGGRVTELVARPMLNLFFPELSGIMQPLSGEYAGRREVLERVPFFSGYAVETGLLIDIQGQFGLSAIAQVDLKERIHHNQPLAALSKMSHVIIQAIFERLNDHRIINLLGEPSQSMKIIGDDEGRLFLDVEELYNVERPPIVTVPAYRARRAFLKDTSGRVSGGDR
jgi:hypothetical protein